MNQPSDRRAGVDRRGVLNSADLSAKQGTETMLMPNRDNLKSDDHLAFFGKWEFFRVGFSVFRAPRAAVVFGGYRLSGGARFCEFSKWDAAEVVAPKS